MASSIRASENVGATSAQPYPSRIDELLADLRLQDEEEEKVTVRLPCGKTISARRNRNARNKTGAYAPWVLMQDDPNPQVTVANREFNLEQSQESTTSGRSIDVPDLLRPEASKSGKDMSLLKCIPVRTTKSVRSTAGETIARPGCQSTHVSTRQKLCRLLTWKEKKMNFLRHTISLYKHLISKRVADLLAYEEEMREDHELFELVIDIRRNPHDHRVFWRSDEWYVLEEIVGIPNSKLERELEKRDIEAKLEHIDMAKEIYQLEHDLEGLRIARNRLRSSEE
ncbi:hypothetical protein IWZ03DRAFT_418654 [Phyllosticta citriasiana]|uniref:Uncharacterized protein n=1 Tax=Phyllosticta citriasiana TaxID=595635 RepID=A0ABR1KCE6_9PEZI